MKHRQLKLIMKQPLYLLTKFKDIFESVDNLSIIGFIKDAHFYHQL